MDNIQNIRRFIQFELWKTCNYNCPFCYNGIKRFENKIDKKLNNILFVKDHLNNDDMTEFNTFGLIGGEFFNKEANNVKNEFIDLILTIKSKKFDQIMITSNMIYKDTSFLEEILEILSDENVLICTSWDSKYRFTDETLEIWENNMKMLHQKNINTHVETILTKNFLQKVLDKEINCETDLVEKYQSRFDYMAPNCGYNYKDKFEMNKFVPDFFPERQLFMKWVQKIYNEGQVNVDDLFNIKQLNANTLYQEVDGSIIKITDREKHNTILPCDNINKTDYIDSDEFMRDDLRKFLQ